jgi:glycosyltransferase involved in cell wall biosynthesis
MFSVLILTLNEERNLPGCLSSAASCDDLVVLDSGSTDATAAIASAAGARVFVRPFDNFAGQRNYAQRAIAFKHRWVFHLDADEQLTPELFAECRACAAAAGPDLDGYFVAPKMLWMGRWIPHCTDFPAYQARFVRAPEFVFVEVGHGQREAPSMRLGWMQTSYLHDLSGGGEAEWLAKHRRYARVEAEHHLNADPGGGRLWLELFASEPLRQRRALKRLSYALPARPLLRFVYQYLLRGGFLDGLAGLRYCRLLARYEGFTAEALRQLRRAALR